MTKRLVFGGILLLAGILGGCKPGLQPGGDAQPEAPSASSPAAVTTAAETDQQAPKLFFLEQAYDAGTVKQGDVIRHTFVVKNRGLGQLNIEKVKGS